MFLDSVNIKEINENMKLGVIKGVTSNPTLLLKEGQERTDQIIRILNTDVELLFVQIVGDTLEEMKNDYETITNISTEKTIGLKVSLNSIGLEFIKKVKEKDKVQIILGTAVYSADQGILGALAGCDYLAPYVNRMSNNNLDPYRSIKQMRTFIDDRGLDTEIMGASFKNSNQVVDALIAGAHMATISNDILNQMINKELAANAIQVFNNDGDKLEDLYKKK